MKHLLFLLLSCTMLQAQTFTFTAIPDQNVARLEERFSKVADYLSKTLNIDVKYIPVKSYAASVTAFKNNEVQLAWFGGLSGVRARLAVPGSQALAQGAEDLEFVTYFIAHHSTGMTVSDIFPDMSGKTFTFGSKGSTSGRLMPEFYVRTHTKKKPGAYFKRVGFSGDHSKTIALVQNGSYELGAVNFKVWDKEKEKGIIDESKVKVIWKTPVYPDYNWSIRGDVDKAFGKGFMEKVRQALLNMDDPDLLASFPRSSFIPANNQMYQPILDVAREIGLIEK